MKKKLKKVGKISLIVFLSILGVVVLTIGSLNIAKYSIYEEYYSIRNDICKIPGINKGFVPQGIAIVEEKEKILVSGYMKNGDSSRIYVTDFNNNSYYVSLEKEGKSFIGHAGGVAISNNKVYLASEATIYTINLEDILDIKDNHVLDIGSGQEVNNAASFVYTDDTYLYVGEFHNGKKYVTNHIYETKEGVHHAIVSRYDLNDLTKPNKIYSIRNSVQGICFTPDGKIILSTSHGLLDTIYYIYNEQEATNSEYILDGASVYFLDNLSSEVEGPAMGEGLDYYEGEIITLTESASNKFIFGKFFGGNKIVRLDFFDNN